MKFDGVINISVTTSRKSTNYSNQEILWSDFVSRLSSSVYTKETMVEYEAMDKGTQDDIKDVGGFVGGSLKDNKRRKGHVISRSVLTLDADYAYEGMEGIIDLLYGFSGCVYSTHKHRKDKPRLRFVIPLSRRVSGDEYEAIARMVANDMGMDYFDDSTYEPERLMYFPSTSKDGEFVYRVSDGKWLDVDEVLSRYKVWDDYDDSNLRYYLEKNYGIYAPVKTDDAISTVAKNRAFHPIRDYINSLTWDGVSRVDTLLVDYLGAEDSDYTRAVIRKAMVAAIARIFEPGVKFDYMPVLVGPQGVGKSHILSLIEKSWYSDSFNTVIGKEAYEQLQGCWIIEMAELSAIRKAEAEAVKHFISKREDVYRAAYGRRVTKHKRQCVFFGTTNDIEFLKDKTGNRRYWPVVVAKQKPLRNMWKQLNKEEVNQIWAEAKCFYDKGEPLVMNEKLSHEAIKKQEQHMEANIKEGMIIEYLDMLLPKDWNLMDIGARRRYISGSDFADIKGTEKRERVCAMEIWCELFGGDARNMNPMQSREINDILRKIKGWEMYPRSNGKVRFAIYGLQKTFVREGN